MPIQPSEIKVVETADILENGRSKINDNFEVVRQFVNFLETSGGGSGAGGSSTSETVTQAGHGFVVGDVIRHNGSAYIKANAQNTANATALGMVAEVLSATQFIVTFSGKISGLTGLTPGVVYFLQNNGSLGTTPGTVARTILGATSSTSGVFLNEASASSLGGLSDVSLAGLGDNKVLTYVAAEGKWVPAYFELNTLFDVTGSPTNGQVLMYDSGDGKWKPATLGGGGGGDMYKAVYDTNGDGVVDAAAFATNAGNANTVSTVNANTISTGTVNINRLPTITAGKIDDLPISKITGLQGALDGKSNTNHTHANASGSVAGFMSTQDKDKLAGATNLASGGTLMQRDGSGRARVATPSDDSDIANKSYVDTAVAGAGGGSGTYDINIGNINSSTSVNLANNKSVTARGTLTGASAGVTFTNVPSSGVVIVTLVLTENATGGYSLAYPANTLHLNGGNGSLNTAANAVNVVTLVTVNGGTNWFAAVADTRANVFDPFYLNPPANGTYYFTINQPMTIDFTGANVIKGGTGSVAFATSSDNGSSWTTRSSSWSKTGTGAEVVRATVTGFSGFFTVTIPRTA